MIDRTHSSTQMCREQTLSSTWKSPNVQAASQRDARIPTPAWSFSPRACPDWERLQPLSRRLALEPKTRLQVSLTISSQYLSTSHTSWNFFPTRKVTFHVSITSFSSWASVSQGLHPWPPPAHTAPILYSVSHVDCSNCGAPVTLSKAL